jgi:phage/plasmid primase-like uncharacterized protein
LPAIIAFDSGNLLDVARVIRARDPERPIIFAADNDQQLPHADSSRSNVGAEKADAAARAVQGIVLTPVFAPSDRGTEWNDYAVQHGKAAVLERFRIGLRPHGIALSAPPARPVTQADRDAARQRTTAFPNGTASPADQAAADAARAAERQRPSDLTL